MGRKYGFWEGADIRLLKRLRATGESYQKIAAQMCRTLASVKWAARTYGVSVRRPTTSKDRRREVVRLRDEGRTPTEITTLLPSGLKCCRAQVYRDIKRASRADQLRVAGAGGGDVRGVNPVGPTDADRGHDAGVGNDGGGGGDRDGVTRG